MKIIHLGRLAFAYLMTGRLLTLVAAGRQRPENDRRGSFEDALVRNIWLFGCT